MSDTRNWTPNLKSRIGIAVVELALVGVAWYVLKLDDLLAGAIAAVIVVSTILPGRWSVLASGLGMIGLAGLAQFHYGHRPLAIVLLVFGVITLTGLMSKMSRR